MEAVGAELLEQPVASESVFDRVFDLGEMAFDTSGGVQVVVQALEDVGGVCVVANIAPASPGAGIPGFQRCMVDRRSLHGLSGSALRAWSLRRCS